MVQNNELDESVEHTKENFRKYRLTEVPEGYSLKSETFEEDFQRYQIIYSSESGDILYIKQTWQQDDTTENLTSNTEVIKDVNVNGFTGYYVEDRGISSLIVSNGVYKLVLDGKFSKEELKNVVSKLELDNQPIE